MNIGDGGLDQLPQIRVQHTTAHTGRAGLGHGQRRGQPAILPFSGHPAARQPRSRLSSRRNQNLLTGPLRPDVFRGGGGGEYDKLSWKFIFF